METKDLENNIQINGRWIKVEAALDKLMDRTVISGQPSSPLYRLFCGWGFRLIVFSLPKIFTRKIFAQEIELPTYILL